MLAQGWIAALSRRSGSTLSFSNLRLQLRGWKVGVLNPGSILFLGLHFFRKNSFLKAPPTPTAAALRLAHCSSMLFAPQTT